MNKTLIYIGICIVISVISFFIGRSNSTISEKIKYVKGETIYKTITKDSLVYKSEIPDNPIYPTKIDTFYVDSIQYKTITIDSAKVLKEYIQKRTYDIKLFDDKNGKLIVKPIIQYNELQSLPYEYTPISKEITKTIQKTFTPFIHGGYNSFGYSEIGGGIYYHDIAIQCNYVTDFKYNGISIGMDIKF